MPLSADNVDLQCAIRAGRRSGRLAHRDITSLWSSLAPRRPAWRHPAGLPGRL